MNEPTMPTGNLGAPEAQFAAVDALLQCRDEFLAAMRRSPYAPVATPAGPEPFALVISILHQEIVSAGERHLAAMVEFITSSAYESSDPNVRLMGLSWMAGVAERHAQRQQPKGGA